MATEIIKVPDIGTSEKVTIIEVSVKAGDTIAEDDTLIVLESDKASMDIPAPKAGKITQIKVSEGDEIGEGDEILYLDVEGSTGESDDAEEPSKSEAKPAAADSADSSTKTPSDSGSVKSLTVPDIGSDEAVDIIEVHVKPGDTIAEDDPIVTLESDKASMEVPALEAGEVVSVKVSEGDQVKEGDLLIEFKGSGESKDNKPASDEAADDTEKSSPAASDEGESTTESVKVPDIGTDDAVDIIEVHVKPGDTIAEDDPVVTLESDKASMEVPSPKAGEVVSVKVEVGNEVKEGDLLIELTVSSTSKGSSPAPQERSSSDKPSDSESTPSSTPAPQSASIVSGDDDEIVRPSKPVHAGPAVRKLAREFGVDLALVSGTGPKGRIVKDDVAAYVKNKMREPEKVTGGAGIPAVPDQDFSKFGEIEEKDMSRIQKLTAAKMTRDWLNIPHVTQFDDADVTELESFRQSLKPEMEKRGIKISPLAFLAKACASALREFPNFNVSLKADGKSYVQKDYVHIGIAVDTPNGLIVPVIRDVDQKSIWQIAEEIIDFAQRGRKGKVKSNEMQGGCFTISSLGALGGTAFTPIVNAPEVAILGVSKNQVKPHWNGQSFEPRTFTPLSLSYDHRAVNGADAARFTTYLCEALADLRRLLL